MFVRKLDCIWNEKNTLGGNASTLCMTSCSNILFALFQEEIQYYSSLVGNTKDDDVVGD